MPAKKQLTRDDPIEERAPEIIRRLSEAYPDAKVALHFTNPLECLVATVLSAQSTDETVNRVTATLFQKYRTAEDYLRVPEDELKADIHATGFFNQKAISIREACRRIVEEYGGEVPGTMEDLITLRGVARKTANIVLGNSFGDRRGHRGRHPREPARPSAGVLRAEEPRQDRAGPDAVGPARTSGSTSRTC